MMELTRRKFICLTGSLVAGHAFGGLGGFDLLPVEAHAEQMQFAKGRESKTICPYCSVGCGAIVHSYESGDRRTSHVEGDPDNVINRGALCSKGSSLYQLVENEKRLTRPKYRAPFSDKWQTVSWDWALDKIARRVQESRDASFTYLNERGRTVNRAENIASMGSATMNNEECWLYQALLRSLGLVYIEHQARL